MANNRIFYASHGVNIRPSEPVLSTYQAVNGVQSVAINTNFALEQSFQLSRLAIYDNVQTDSQVEVTINKAFDGHPLIWTVFVDEAGTFVPYSLVGTANHRGNIRLHVGLDIDENLVNEQMAIEMTGCYISSFNYTFPVDGNLTEEITFVGNHKNTLNPVGTFTLPDANPNTRVLRRQNVDVVNSTFPDGITVRKARLQNISFNGDLGRESMYALGAFAPYHRYVNFPLEITVSFEFMQTGNPGGGAYLVGPDFDTDLVSSCEAPVSDSGPIVIVVCTEVTPDAYTFDLGTGTLQSVSYSGGDTGGGNVTETWTYQVFNTLTITENQTP